MYLCTTVGFLGNTESNEPRISQFHQDVIHTIHMAVFQSSLFHIIQDVAFTQRSVQATIAIWKKKIKEQGETLSLISLS